MPSESARIKRMSKASQRLRVVVFSTFCACVALFCAASAPLAHAQSPTQKFTLTAVNFIGLSQYAPEQVERAAGLVDSTSITIDDLANAAARLGKSGAFDAVNYRYTTRGANLTAEITVTESKHVLRCRFDNFVWFSNDELEQTLKSKVPAIRRKQIAGKRRLHGASPRGPAGPASRERFARRSDLPALRAAERHPGFIPFPASTERRCRSRP